MSPDPAPIDVLHVGGHESAPGLAERLERGDDRIAVTTVADAAAGLAALENGDVDCVVAAHDLPDGIEFLAAARESHPHLPLVLVAADGSEAISARVTDYVPGKDADLAARIVDTVERSREQHAAIAEHTPDAIVAIDAEGTIRFANPAVESVFGYEPAALIGEPFSTLLPARHREALARYLGTDERTLDRRFVEFEGRTADGREIPLSISFGEFEAGNERRFVGIMRDVSERAGIEDALREREERFRQLAENIREVVWMSDPEKEEMLYVNGAYEEVWGRSRESLYEEPLSFLEAIHPGDRDRVEAALQAQADGEYDEEYRIVRPDGEVRWIRDRAVPVRDDGGEVYRVVGIASDVTARREYRAALERQNERLEEFASVVSHDLRNPLSVVEGRLELARERRDDADLDRAAAALDRAFELIDDLLALAREGDAAAELTDVDLAAAAEGCWANVATADATLAVETDRTVRTDEGRLGQLLENLMRNAIDHGGEGLTVTVGDTADGFYVADDGPGIPPGDRERVFEPGYSTGEGGTGFGLSIVRRIAENHGWTVSVTESADGGVRFEVSGVGPA